MFALGSDDLTISFNPSLQNVNVYQMKQRMWLMLFCCKLELFQCLSLVDQNKFHWALRLGSGSNLHRTFDRCWVSFEASGNPFSSPPSLPEKKWLWLSLLGHRCHSLKYQFDWSASITLVWTLHMHIIRTKAASTVAALLTGAGLGWSVKLPQIWVDRARLFLGKR